MAVIKVTQDNFESEVLKSDKPVLVDFNADWCGPCKMLAPTMDAIAADRDDIKVVSINIDDEDERAEKYEVFSIPCVVVIRNGEEVNRSVGLRPRAAIEGLLR